MTPTQLRKNAKARFSKALVTYDDLRVLATARQGAGWTPPVLTKFAGGSPGIGLWLFSKSAENELSVTAQMPHGYKTGSLLYPHFHFCTNTTTATGVLQWGVEYILGTQNIVTPQAFTGVQTIYATYTFNANQQSKHLLVATAAPITPPADFGMSSLMLARIFRNVAVGSNYDEPIFLCEFDIHVQLDTLGSDDEYQKLDE